MRRGISFPNWAERFIRCAAKSRQTSLGISAPHHRRLVCEMLEDRRLLSVGGFPELPGMVLVDPRPDQFEGQIIYLDFDGAEDVTYNGPVEVGPFDVPAFQAPEALAGREVEIMSDVARRLNELFADTGVTFTIHGPAAEEYSTVYIGGDGLPLADHGTFLGLAAQVDIGNLDRLDSAWVFTDRLDGSSYASILEYADVLTSVIGHEGGHLLGYAHSNDQTYDSLSSVGASLNFNGIRLTSNPGNPGSGSWSKSTSGTLTVETNEEFWIEVDFENRTTDKPGGVNISLPGFTGTALSYAWYSWEGDTQGTRTENYYPVDSTVWHKNGYQITTSAQIFEGYDTHWESWDLIHEYDEDNVLRVRLRAPSTNSTFYVYFRGWLNSESNGSTIYEAAPSSGSFTDQQGYYVYRYTVNVEAPDNVGPNAPGSVDVTPNSTYDTGQSQTDNITKNSNPQFQWTKPIDRGSPASGTKDYYEYQVVDSDGNTDRSGFTSSTSVRPGSLSDDNYEFFVRAQDNAGNWGLWGSCDFTVDTTKPTMPWNLTNPEDPTVDPTPNVTWSGDDNSGGSGIDHYVIAWDEPDDGNFAADFELESSDTQLSDSEWNSDGLDRVGVWNWWVRAIDVAGNESDWAPSYTDGKDLTFVVPTVVDARWEKPYGTEVSDVNENDTVYLVVEATNFSTSYQFTANVWEDDLWEWVGDDDDPVLGGQDIEILHYSGNTWRATWPAVWIQDKWDGFNNDPELYFKLDSYGTESGNMKVRDKTAPGMPTFDSDSSSHQPNIWSNEDNLTIYWTEPSDGSGIDGYSVVADTSPSTLPDSTGLEVDGQRYIYSPDHPDGDSIYLHVRAKDNSDNWATDANVAHFGPFKIDTTDPGVPGELCNPQNPTTDVTPNVTWSEPTETGSGIWKYEIVFDDGDWDFGVIRDRTFWSANGDTDLDAVEIDEVLTVGKWQWWVKAYDLAGNESGWAPGHFDGKAIEIVEPSLTSVQWKTTSGGTVTDGQQFKVGEDVRIYVEADYAQVGDSFTVYVYEDDGVDFDNLIDTVQVPILTSDGTQGTGYATWEVPWYPDNNFASDIGIGDIYPEYRLWDTTSGWTWPASTHKSDALIEAHGGELPNGKWTVITHGLQSNADEDTYRKLVDNDDASDDGSDEGWMWELADKIRAESINVVTGLSNVVIHTVKAATGEIWNEDFDATESPIAIADQSKHHVLLFDWAEVSNYEANGDVRFRVATDYSPSGSPSDDGFAEASGDALYSLLRKYGIAGNVDTLIGHSRGAIVMTEAAQRILQAGLDIDQVFFLDAEGGGTQEQFSDPAFGLYDDEEFWAWEGVETENIYSPLNEGAAADIAVLLAGYGLGEPEIAAILALLIPDVDFGGHEVAGAKNVDLGLLTGVPYAHSAFGPFPGVYDYLIGGHALALGDPGLFVLNGDILTVDTPSQSSGVKKPTSYDAPGAMELAGGDFAYDSTGGWWYHGGGNEATGAGGGAVENERLVLDQRESRTHNWAYVPATVKSVEFDYDVTDTSSSSELVVSWGDENNSWTEIGRLPLTSSGWIYNQRVDLPPGTAGDVGRLEFTVAGSDSANVHLDNISWSEQFAPAPEIDVESGGTSDVHVYDFGNVPIGQSVDATFTVRNEGDATLIVEQASGLGVPFTIDITNEPGSGDDWTIELGEPKTFIVTFSPISVTSYTDTLTLMNNDKDEGSYQISFSGTGIAPEIDVELPGQPDNVHSYSFDEVRTGQSASQTFTVRNEGGATLTVTQASGLGAPFTIDRVNGTESGDNWSIESGDTVEFVIVFSPTTATGYSDTLSLLSDDPDEGSYEITLSGIGSTPDVDVELSGQPDNVHSYDFGGVGVGTNTTQQFTVRNEGTGDLRVDSASGLDGTAFSVSPPNDSESVDDWIILSSGTRTFTISFAPSALTTYSEVLTLSSDDPDEGSYEITLTGEGVAAGVRITESDGSTNVTEGGTTDTYEVVLVSAPTANVTITIAGDSQVTPSPITLTFTPDGGEHPWDVPQTVTVTAVDDDVDEDSPHFGTITHTVSSADQAYEGISVNDVTVNVTDNDTAGITVTAAPGLVTTESGGTATLTVVLDSEPTAEVTFGLSSSDTGEGTVSPASMTFGPDDWNQFKPVTVTGVDDQIDDGDVGYTINIVAVSSDDPKYDGLVPDLSVVPVTNEDDEEQSLVVSPLSLEVNEGGTVQFTVRLGVEPVSDVTVNIAKEDGGDPDLSASPESLTFTSDDWNVGKPVNVSAAQDDDVANGTADFVVSSAGVASQTVTATERDNDFSAYYDFGMSNSPVADDYTPVTPETRYTPDLGYGWLTGDVWNRDRGRGSALECDFNFTKLATFVVDVAEEPAEYEVTVTLGDLGPYWHDRSGVYLEGDLVGELSTARKEMAEPAIYRVQVNDGQLTLMLDDLGGSDPYVCIAAMSIVMVQSNPTPPVPDPSTWQTEPYTTGPASIRMVATAASDPSGVEYFFDETSGNAGGTDSGWQDDPTYEDTGLSAGTDYTYQVKTRDKSADQTEGGYSEACSATTYPAEDTTPPTPDPGTWQTEPYATGPTSIRMVATTANDPSGVEYYFQETSGNPGGSDSGWQDSRTYEDTGLSPGTDYTYQVKTRDKSASQNEGESSTTESVSTPAEFRASFDFGTSGSPVADGYTQVTPETGYTDALGYGWESGMIHARDRRSGSDLDRDFNFTKEGAFAVAVPNGTYEVDVTLGDRGAYWHDRVGVYLEGIFKGEVSTDRYEMTDVQSYTVDVVDGKLTLKLDDLGGTDPNVCISALDIALAELLDEGL